MKNLVRCAYVCALTFLLGAARATTVTIDDAQARAALFILHELQQNEIPSTADWARLFATAGYRRLKQREAQFKVPFSDDQFKAFLTAPAEVAQTNALQKTLDAWSSAKLSEMETRARAYLPANSTLHATIYPLIKPRHNSFVYQLNSDPAVMLYVDPAVTQAQFANTVSHELFHVGDAENCPPVPVAAAQRTLSTRQQAFLEWLSAFGEGSAVLAAAGGPNVDPHATDLPSDRAVWDAAMSQFPKDFVSLEQFFTDIANGTLAGDAIATKGMTFFGEVQGPWYTVGYKMDVTIQNELGKTALVRTLCDKRSYFRTYNAAATKVNARTPHALPLWPENLVTFLTGT